MIRLIESSAVIVFNGLPSVSYNRSKIKRIASLAVFTFFQMLVGQNTASSSGNWSACSTWGNPTAIYRNTTDTKTISSGVTVTADAVWSTAAIVLNGSGAVAYNSGIFTDFVNDQGADASCIPPVPPPNTSASYSYLCHSQRNAQFITQNGFVVIPSVGGDIYQENNRSYDVSSMCGHNVCTSNDVTGNFHPNNGPSVITLSFSRPVTNIRLIFGGLSIDEKFMVTTDNGFPTLSTCSDASIAGNTFDGSVFATVPTHDINIGGIWYTSITLTTVNGLVFMGYGYGAASSY